MLLTTISIKSAFFLECPFLIVLLFSLLAVGCPDFQPVTDAWIRRSESTAVVVCNNTRETWHFVCRDNYWVGELRNCTHREYAICVLMGGVRGAGADKGAGRQAYRGITAHG